MLTTVNGAEPPPAVLGAAQHSAVLPTFTLWAGNADGMEREPYPFRRLSEVVIVSRLLDRPAWARSVYVRADVAGVDVLIAARNVGNSFGELRALGAFTTRRGRPASAARTRIHPATDSGVAVPAPSSHCADDLRGWTA
jgi:hypothetical protein